MRRYRVGPSRGFDDNHGHLRPRCLLDVARHTWRRHPQFYEWRRLAIKDGVHGPAWLALQGAYFDAIYSR